MSDFGTPEHRVRTWLVNNLPLYREIVRMATKWDVSGPDRISDVVVLGVRDLCTDVVYGPNGVSSYRHLYRQAHGQDRYIPWAAVGEIADEIRTHMTRAEFDAIDWPSVTADVMETTDHPGVSA